jgi:hypothetical protein
MSGMPFQDFLDLAGVTVDDGHIVTAKTMRVVEIIRDYDRRLEVEWVPPEHRQPGDNAIRIVDTRQRGLARIVMSFRDEGEFTARDGADVLERLFLADHAKGDPVARMNAANAAAKVIEAKRQMDRVEETKDIGVHALRSPLHRYTAKDPVTGEKRVYE